MVLKVDNIVKSFGRKKVLRGVSFNLKEGGLYGLVGENGSGKSTILKIIIRLLQANEGEIIINGRIGYCPQEPLVFSQLTVEENAHYFSLAYGLEQVKYQQQFDYLLQHFNFEKNRKDKVEVLSGGTKQKLNLSLALLHRPELLILDEPYNGFDWNTYMQFWELSGILQKEGCTILIVTHLLNEKDKFDYIYKLKNGQLK